MNKVSAKPLIVPEEPDRSLTGGPCFICKRPLITSLAMAPLMTKASIRATRAEKLQRDFITKFLSKDMQLRTVGDMTYINSAVPVDPKAEVIAVTCGHLFHRHCFREYSEKYKLVKRCCLVECPLCRKTVLLGNAVALDVRPMDCGPDKLPLPVSKEIKNLRKEGTDMLAKCAEARMNYCRGLLFYMEQMFRIKNFKREILEYYHPFWMNEKNIERLRIRRDELKKEVNERALDNLNQAILFLTKLETDKRLPPVTVLCLRRLRSCREGIDSFRSLVKVIQKCHMDPCTGEINVRQFTDHLVEILSDGFKFRSEIEH